MLPLLLGLGVGLAGSIGKMFGRGQANKKMESLMKQDPAYAANPLAGQRLALAQTMLNARMPGVIQAERNILSNQGNQINNVNRVATDASQALAFAAGIGGNTDRQLADLGLAESQDYYNRLNNVFDAQQGVINEGDKVFGDQVRRYGNQVQMQGAINENKQNNWGDISNLGFGLADFAANGGFNFGGNGNRVSQLSSNQTGNMQRTYTPIMNGTGNRPTPSPYPMQTSLNGQYVRQRQIPMMPMYNQNFYP